MNKYAAIIRWSDEDGGFIAAIPKFRGLTAFGKTQEEALRELEVAAGAYLESWQASGRPLPPPEKVASSSGQLRLRMPKGLHARLAQGALCQGVSLNTYLVSLLSERQGEAEALIHFQKALESMGTSVVPLPVRTGAKRPNIEPESPAVPAEAVKEKNSLYKRKRATGIS